MNLNAPILTPEELIEYRRAAGDLRDFPPPQTVIFAPQKSLALHVLRSYSTRSVKGFMGEFYLLKKSGGRIGFSTGFGIGAPVIAGLTEEFAALGIRQFVLIGMAGGLQDSLRAGSVILSTGAIRGEGVTRHYLPPSETVEASEMLLDRIGAALSKKDIPFDKGITWTTDAPFREMRRDVLEHQAQGVMAVDMEAAAVFGVAKSRGLEACAVFSIADLLAGGVWRMSRDLRDARKCLAKVFDAIHDAFA
jgi:uridine phosphorylase